MNVIPLIAGEGYFFCRDTKEAKKQVSKKGSLPHQAPAAKRSEPRAGNLLPITFIPPASAKVSYAPAKYKTTIVLPDFGRSCSADGRKEILKSG